jgi:hypothetical protein
MRKSNNVVLITALAFILFGPAVFTKSWKLPDLQKVK